MRGLQGPKELTKSTANLELGDQEASERWHAHADMNAGVKSV